MGLKGRVETCPQAVAESKAASHAAAWMILVIFLRKIPCFWGSFGGWMLDDDKGVRFLFLHPELHGFRNFR